MESLLENASSTSYFKLRTEHINKYQEKFNRVSLKLGDDKNAELPASKRLYEFQKNDDPAFAALYFQFGRYLMIRGKQYAAQSAGTLGKRCPDALEWRLPSEYQCSDELLAGRSMQFVRIAQTAD